MVNSMYYVLREFILSFVRMLFLFSGLVLCYFDTSGGYGIVCVLSGCIHVALKEYLFPFIF